MANQQSFNSDGDYKMYFRWHLKTMFFYQARAGPASSAAVGFRNLKTPGKSSSGTTKQTRSMPGVVMGIRLGSGLRCGTCVAMT